MSETLYEGYKDALRRGHVAALRGRLVAAVAAYREASRMAPDRALPYVGLAGVLARLGRSDEALAAYTAALGRAPNDEGALRGRADIEAETGRRADAASTLDRLAAVLESQGRLGDACDVARRALELAESRGRRRGVAALVARLRQTIGDPSAAEALERALSVLEVDPMAVPGPAAGSDIGAASGGSDGAKPHDVAPIPAPDPGALTLAVEVAIDAGDLDEARRRAVLAAAGHRSLGRLHAAIDACYEALAIAPADPDIHLALAELYLDQGWRALAADKLVLLGRLVQLTGDSATRARLCDLAGTRFADDPRLAAICA
jgi:tetratricopeptide (TPR) repeat protein